MSIFHKKVNKAGQRRVLGEGVVQELQRGLLYVGGRDIFFFSHDVMMYYNCCVHKQRFNTH